MKPKQARLYEVSEIITGIVEDKNGEGIFRYPCYQANSFSDSGEVFDLSTITKKEAVSERQFVREGDVLIKRLNPNFPLLVVDPPEEGVISSNLFIIRAGPDIEPSYLAFLFEQASILLQITQISGASFAIKAVSAKKLKNVVIPVFSFDMQQQIGQWWVSGKRRKKLLLQYISENDRLMATVADTILQ